MGFCGTRSLAAALSRVSLPLQRSPRQQSLPQRAQLRLLGLSRPRALRGCSQQDLRRGAWSGPPSRTAPGRRPAWTSPTRSPGSLLNPIASPGQGGEEEGREQVGAALGVGGMGMGMARPGRLPLS